MIHRQRQVGIRGFADRFPIVPALRHPRYSRCCSIRSATCSSSLERCSLRFTPRRRRAMGGVEAINVSGIERELRMLLPSTGEVFTKNSPLSGSTNLPSISCRKPI